MKHDRPPFEPFLHKKGIVILDGGLATELEKYGFDLNHPLWSARLLDSAPESIGRVHRRYLEAGADCIIAASYQASIPGFVRAGYSYQTAVSLLETSVQISCEIRDAYFGVHSGDRIKPLVAASVGPYGAYLADGSEYKGHYGITDQELFEFHQERMNILASSPADLIACETIPSYQEAGVLKKMIGNFPANLFWVSFSCRDGRHLYDGTPVQFAAALYNELPQVVAIGVNCTAPLFISDLIEQIKAAIVQKEIIVYPNSGETYQIKTKSWAGDSDADTFALLAQEWYDKGARIIGGCCRTGPNHIKELRSAFNKLQGRMGIS